MLYRSYSRILIACRSTIITLYQLSISHYFVVSMISPTQRRVLLVSFLIGIIAISIHAQEENVALRGHRRLQENVMVYDSGEPPAAESPAAEQPQEQQQSGEIQEEERDGEDWSPPELTQEDIEAKQIRSYLGGLESPVFIL